MKRIGFLGSKSKINIGESSEVGKKERERKRLEEALAPARVTRLRFN